MADKSYRLYQIPLHHYGRFRFMLKSQGILYQEVFRLDVVHMNILAAHDHHQALAEVIADFDHELRSFRVPVKYEALLLKEIASWSTLKFRASKTTRFGTFVASVEGTAQHLDSFAEALTQRLKRARRAAAVERMPTRVA